MKDWHTKVLAQLKGRSAPRVLTTSMLSRLSEAERPGVQKQAVIALVREAEALGILWKARGGLYLNRAAIPPAIPEEAAQNIRRGAVVSLLSVLGDAGILNNPTPVIYSVVPVLEGETPPSVGKIESEGRIYRFHGVSERVMFAGSIADRFDTSVLYPRATPEAALCHWLYLAKSRRSRLRPPSHESDASSFDRDRLSRLAKAAGMEKDVTEWLAAAERYAEEVPDHNSALGF